jgi:hypothetical protein
MTRFQATIRGLAATAVLIASTAIPAIADDKSDASALLQSATNNREVWGKDFPGFHARLTVDKDNRSAEGTVAVSASGKVEITLVDESLRTVAQKLLGSMISHRFAGKAQYSPTYGPDDKHPQGRSVLLNDSGQSMYRIRDGQILQVNRSMGPSKFTIDILENRMVESGHHLPVAYTVTYRNPGTGALERVDSYNERFVRVQKFYLPSKLRVVSAGAAGTEITEIALTSPELNMVSASR